MNNRRQRADWVAAAMVAVIGGPLIWFGAMAAADGETRRRETPVRALIGDAAFDALTTGTAHPQHYVGDDRTAPDFELQDAEGQTWRLSEHRGKVVVMNFWTVTCQPCVEEMPSLIELQQVIGDRDDIELVTVSVDADHATTRTVVPQSSGLTVLIDADRSIVRDGYGTRQFPETWIIDPDGVIRLRVDGPRPWSSALALNVIESYL